jgi:hypothetical protein
MSDDESSEENPLRDLIGEENFLAMPEEDRLWMANTVARVEHEGIVESIRAASIEGEQEDEERQSAEFDAHGNQVAGTRMPKSVRVLLRKILGETEDQDRNHRQIAAGAAYSISAAQFAGSRLSASYVIDQMEEDGDLQEREAVSAYIMFDEMLAVRFLEQSVYNQACAAAANTECGMQHISRAEFREIVEDRQRLVMKRLLAAASKAIASNFEGRFESLTEEDHPE